VENFERQARDARAAAAGEAKRIQNGIADGDTVSIEDFARLAIETERSQTEMANPYRGILAQLPLCVLQTLFAAFDNDEAYSGTGK
jgi:hypothetical protein